jgi:hypothetical protein
VPVPKTSFRAIHVLPDCMVGPDRPLHFRMSSCHFQNESATAGGMIFNLPVTILQFGRYEIYLSLQVPRAAILD